MTSEIFEKQIKKIALLVRYGAKEKVFILIGTLIFGFAAFIPKLNDEFLNLSPELGKIITLGLYVLGGLCLGWVAYRFVFKIALPKPQDDRELPNAIKGLLAFTEQDGELFFKLGRNQELNSLNNFIKDPQTPLVVIMGESGAGKSSLLRAGLSYSLKGSDSAYVYWEALPHNTVAGLLHAVNSVLNTDIPLHSPIQRIPEANTDGSFDVFFSHNSQEKPIVRELAQALKARGLKVWLDEEQLTPGQPWQEELETIIKTTQASAVLIGENGLGSWENPEMRACLSEFVDRKQPVIPVLLPNAAAKPELPLFLKALTWVDLREGLTDQELDKLVKGITYNKPKQTSIKPEEELPTLNTDLDVLLKIPQKAVIVLDQFEQLQPDNPEHKPIFELLHKVCAAPPPDTVTWRIAFRREYSATWCDFERGHDLRPPMLSLKLFNAVQAQNVFVTLAEAAGLSLEQDLVDGFIQAVSREQRVSPVEIGIGLQMLNELAQGKQKSQLSLQDYNFAGGSQGLFVSFLGNALAQRFPEPAEREALYKVLLECIDLNRNQRVAEGKSMAELAANSPGLWAGHLQYALDYFASGQMRILELIPGDPPRYRLPHETLIPALRQLGGKILSEVAEAEFLLQTAYAAWQNSRNNRRYLLSGKDLKKVRQFQQQLVLGDRATFLKQSKQHRLKKIGTVISVIALTPFFAYYSYQYYLAEKYRSALENWGLPGDLMSYAGQLQSISISDKDVRYLDWLSDFKKLTTLTLYLWGSEITDFSALQELKQLTTLTLALSGSNIADLNFLHELKQLTTLDLTLSGTKIADRHLLGVLKELKQLTTLKLNLSGSKNTDLNDLRELKQLTTLDLILSGTQITNTGLGVLKELKQLNTMTLALGDSNVTILSTQPEHNQITLMPLVLEGSKNIDLSLLHEFKQLSTLTLELEHSDITDLSALQELKQLTTLTLNLERSKITDLIALQKLKQLTTLSLNLAYSNNTDLSPLRELKQLTTLTLDLEGSKKTDLSALRELKQLTTLTLNLGASDISDLSVLHELKQLTTLNLNMVYSNITDLSAIHELKQLNTLFLGLGNSNITDLSTLHELKQLTTLTLNLFGTKNIDLSALHGLKQLTTLSLTLGDSNITNLSALHELKQLTALSLTLGDSNITDLSILHELKQLKMLTLILRYSGITDLSTLKTLKIRQIILDITDTKINSFKGIPNLTGLTMGN